MVTGILLAACLALAALAGAPTAQQAAPGAPTPRARNAFQELRLRIERGEPIRVAFLGGSNTLGNTTKPLMGVDEEYGPYDVRWYEPELHCFRARILDGLQQEFGVVPDQFEEINAGLGGTSSTLMAWRLDQDVLDEHPRVDLVVYEFNINDTPFAGLAPEDDRSVPRSILSVLEQLEARTPRVAVLFVLLTVRGGTAAPTSQLQADCAEVRAQYVRFLGNRLAETGTRSFAVFDAEVPFFQEPLPAFIEGPVFLGPGPVDEQKHGSPWGHWLVAYGAIERLRELMAGEIVTLPPQEPYAAPLTPFPEVPHLLSPEEILASATTTGCYVAPTQDYTEIFDGLQALYADPGATIELLFDGSGVFDLWVQKRYGMWRLNARIRIQIDNGPWRSFAEPNDPGEERLLRYTPVASGLTPGVHRVRIEVLDPPDNGLIHELAFHAFLADGSGR